VNLERLSLRKVLSSIAISTAVAALTASTALIVSYLLFPVTGVEVQDARMFLQSEAQDAIPSYSSLISLNTGNVERRIESNPWVKGAKVMKDWDSGIVTVEVEERKAVLDGNLGSRQVVLAEDGTELPSLGGASLKQLELDETQLEEILKIGKVLEQNGVVLDSVDRVDAGGFEATVGGRRLLLADSLGDDQAQALTALMEEYTEASYFDLRSPNRVVIGAESSEQPGSSGG
jgi:cell division septal protein FtsQ